MRLTAPIHYKLSAWLRGSDLCRYFDAVYVINLASRQDRLPRIHRQLSKLGISQFERIDGIRPDLDSMPTSYVDRMSLAPGARDLATYQRGSLGCKLSHMRLLSIAQREGHQRIIVLEDDATFRLGAARQLLGAVRELPDNWELLYFGANHLQPPVEVSPHLTRVQESYSTFAFALHMPVADEILAHANSSGKEIDVFLAETIQTRGHSYAVRRSIAYPKAGWSDILESKVNYTPSLHRPH